MQVKVKGRTRWCFSPIPKKEISEAAFFAKKVREENSFKSWSSDLFLYPHQENGDYLYLGQIYVGPKISRPYAISHDIEKHDYLSTEINIGKLQNEACSLHRNSRLHLKMFQVDKRLMIKLYREEAEVFHETTRNFRCLF